MIVSDQLFIGKSIARKQHICDQPICTWDFNGMPTTKPLYIHHHSHKSVQKFRHLTFVTKQQNTFGQNNKLLPALGLAAHRPTLTQYQPTSTLVPYAPEHYFPDSSVSGSMKPSIATMLGSVGSSALALAQWTYPLAEAD